MDAFGMHVPDAALTAALSCSAAIVALGAKAVWDGRRRRRAPAAAAYDASSAPADYLAQQRATVLETLYRSALRCERAVREDGEHGREACVSFAATLRRRKLWLSPSLAERGDEFADAAGEADSDALTQALAKLRRQIEIEFRTHYGAAAGR